jgi:short-subunit dehydrogenase
MEKKKISLVTGASSGLGKFLAELLCGEGHRVYVTARRTKLLQSLKVKCSKLGGEVIIIPGDLLDSKFRTKLILKIIKKEKRIDYLFNNAGFGRAVIFENQKNEDIENMITLNVIASQHLTNLVLPHMKKKNSGRFIHTGSVVAFTPLPYFATYNSTKAALYSFNRSLRYELKNTGISSTVVLPARMNTGFAQEAFNCDHEKGKDFCVEKFNKKAGSPYQVARTIVNQMNSGKEVITPTFKSKMWYFMRYFGWVVDLSMKNIIGPKQLKDLKKIK